MTSPIFQLADDYVATSMRLHPLYATVLGSTEFDDRMPDLSPVGIAEREAMDRATLDAVHRLEPQSDADRLCRDLMIERLTAARALYDSGDWARHLGEFVGDSVFLREAFDLMPRVGATAWDNIAARMEQVGATLDGSQATLRAGLAAGIRGPRRQALAEARRCQTFADDRWFDTLVAEAAAAGEGDEPRLRAAAHGANAALAGYAAFLRDQYAPLADPHDGCGPEAYRVHVRFHVGADLDPEEMYSWAWGEFERLRGEIRAVCQQILPGASFPEVVALLDSDPGRSWDTADAYQRWLQDLTDEALVRSAAHFDIPEAMNRCQAMLAPEGSSAAAYYSPPSEDFTRPGKTWWPTLGRSAFPTWSDVTTCYHESVPGHHLQLAYALLQGESLSRFQRNAFIPGHGEGWALYAEQLCDEMGWFANPDHRLGFLAGQQLRAVRVIVDIGMHLGQTIPDGMVLSDGTTLPGGAVWTPELALRFSVVETGNTEEYMRSEIDRYLGWPAQAISYKIGQREWNRIRDEAVARLGERFDLRQFHTFALSKGAIGLDQLRTEIGRFEPA